MSTPDTGEEEASSSEKRGAPADHHEGQKILRELLYCWGGESLDVLVPKKRGVGFLAVPFGHHANKALSYIEGELRCDICGLDGYLCIDCGLKVTCYPDRRLEFASRAMALLTDHYGVPSREIGTKEFFNFVERTQSVPDGNAVLPPPLTENNSL